MTQPCDSCGQPSETPTCLACQSSMQRLGSGDADRRLAQRIAQTRAHLIDLPDIFGQLNLFRLPGSAPQNPDQRSGKSNPSHRSVVNLDVVDLTDTREKANAEPTRTDYDLDRRAGARRQGVLPTLASWSRLVSAELWDEGLEHDEPADEATIVGECGFLLRHLSWIGRQSWFLEMHDDVRTMRADIRRAIGDRDEITALPCLDCTWPMEGQGDYDEDRKRFPWYRCTGCGKTITTQLELDRVEAKAKDTVTLAYAAKTLEKPISTLKEWRQRGWITPEGTDKRGIVFSMSAIREFARTVKHGKRVA